MLYGYGKRIIYRISLFVKEQKNKDNRVSNADAIIVSICMFTEPIAANGH